jgi:hypothetical protein
MILWVLVIMSATGGIATVENINSAESCKALGDRVVQSANLVRVPPITFTCQQTVKLNPI